MCVVQILQEVLDSGRIQEESAIQILAVTQQIQIHLTRRSVGEVGKELRRHGEVTVSEKPLLNCLLLARRTRKIRPIHVGDSHRLQRVAYRLLPLRDLFGRRKGARRRLVSLHQE